MIVFLDTGVLGELSNPNALPKVIACQNWFEKLLARGVYFVSSELCFYEIKRSLVLSIKTGATDEGLKKLNALRTVVDFLDVDQTVVELAAEVWAQARLLGTPTADEKNIDIDMMIVAHWRLLTEEFPGRSVVISTTNVKHLGLFSNAEKWQDISY
ncbi:PIN domain-containing protein [Planktothrix mougeotii]|uniref:Type II toxin-antitoxin system VapC family toxin n=1 Tax=Planktothrix mougeotii LEGE 06226 TaxID=1828728 RepID=A0ABR9U866_9CYAN|nr:type II toxin-antitoxin system VapC family toxin [Planktothrix mougeotii]MBE9142638.1 type II toxin-antitoxin system VapC family toxin [Planktothrix mougeotii LEGE 06226]